MIIGVTGKTGSGKNHYIENIILPNSINPLHIDFDTINHKVLRDPEIIATLIGYFGTQILNTDQTINRRILGKLAFEDDRRYAALMKVTKPLFENIIDSRITLWRERYHDRCNIILNWALLPTTKYWDICDERILVTRSRETRLKASILRDGITEEVFNARERRGIEYDTTQMTTIVSELEEMII